MDGSLSRAQTKKEGHPNRTETYPKGIKTPQPRLTHTENTSKEDKPYTEM